MNEDVSNMLYDKIDKIEEKINSIEIEIDKITNKEYDKLLYEFYRDVILDCDGELHFLAEDERVNNFFREILEDITEDNLSEQKKRKNSYDNLTAKNTTRK